MKTARPGRQPLFDIVNRTTASASRGPLQKESPMVAFQHDDGGRKAAGYKGSAGDCVTRAIAIAAELPYREVYDALAAGNAAQRA